MSTFILRTVDSNRKLTDQLIGKIYDFIDRNSSYPEFKDNFRILFGKEHVADLDDTADEHTKNVYAILNTMDNAIPLYKDNTYYIMTESGSTFRNLSCK